MARGERTKTIGHARAGGEKALTVHCLGSYNHAVKTFEELKLWNDMIFVDVPKHRHLVGSKCAASRCVCGQGRRAIIRLRSLAFGMLSPHFRSIAPC
jgi:hypothetical protein